MKKITILALHLGVGGVENSIISLSNMLCEKYQVEIISTYQLAMQPAFEVDKRVTIQYLLPSSLSPNRVEFQEALKNKRIISLFKEGFKALHILYQKKYKMIQAIKKIDSDIVISTRIYHNELLGKYGNHIPIRIAQEHNHHNYNQKYIQQVIHSVKNIDYLMPVSQELTSFYREKLKNAKTQCQYIPHCIDFYPEFVSNLTSPHIVAIGRLAKEKGYLDMLDVFQKFHEQMQEWQLNICGEGMERATIEQKIHELHLDNYVQLLGNKTKSELNSILLDSSIFLMTSYTESFGLALIDTESYGIPLVAFDSASGAKEIIENNQNGFLIANRDKEQMVNTLLQLAKNISLRKKLGNNGRQKSVPYKKENIAKQWYRFIEEINNA